MKRIFVICPVRSATPEQRAAIEAYVKHQEFIGNKVHYPARDTNQNDANGINICSQNYMEMERANEVAIYWDPNSQGSVFDLGMAFALRKEVVVINKRDLEETDHKSFTNVVIWLGR